ncbi:MAG: UDP-2,4-diacetamido-2,4,6-trideoxy-beta-L-altropyranose hydrolase [Rhodospirillaceae bacterium]|nr:UDP-2,4-diacetamido-2,4,6-trideoxy-beta-L-altropyranose hydrolase [Rhodospirillaceae bacterium]
MPASANIVIRLESGQAIGFGHVKRGLVLAAAFVQMGCDVRFVCRDQPDSYFRTVPHGEKVIWLGGTTPATDAASTLAACKAQAFTPDLMILDCYDFDQAWERAIRAAGAKVLVLEDYAERKHAADFVTGPSQKLKDPACYDDISGTTFLLGAPYLILGPEFARNAFSRGEIAPLKAGQKNLALFFGSADLTQETEKVLAALRDPAFGLAGEVGHVHVVIGAANPRAASLRAALAALPLANLSVQVPSLAGPLSQADVFLTAGGNSMQEGVALGKPSIVIATARNQTDLCEEFASVPYIRYLGESSRVTGAHIAAALQDITPMFNTQIRPAMQAAPIDTQGARRIADAVLGRLGRKG